MNSQYLTKPIFCDKSFESVQNDQQSAQMLPDSQNQLQIMNQQMQMLQYMKLRAIYLQRMQQAKQIKEESQTKKEIFAKQELPVKEESSFKSETLSTHENSPSCALSNIPKDTQTAATTQGPAVGPYIQLSLRDQINFNAYLLRELEKIVRFVITNMGKIKQETLENVRNHYTANPALLQVFDKLVMKYYSAKKCKEDIVRYILRKAFKVIKTNISKQEKVCGKQATLLLCKRYFPANFDQLEKSGVKVKDGDELLEFLMPYRKNSKNKTMNTNFIGEIFSSQNFCQEYQVFLGKFDDLIKEDNDKKVDKLINFLAECVKKDSISKLGSFSRLPWLDVWMEDTIKVATSLLAQFPNEDQFQQHKHKKEEV